MWYRASPPSTKNTDGSTLQYFLLCTSVCPSQQNPPSPVLSLPDFCQEMTPNPRAIGNGAPDKSIQPSSAQFHLSAPGWASALTLCPLTPSPHLQNQQDSLLMPLAPHRRPRQRSSPFMSPTTNLCLQNSSQDGVQEQLPGPRAQH